MTTPLPTPDDLPKPDDPDLAHDQPQGEDADESTSELAQRYGKSNSGSS